MLDSTAPHTDTQDAASHVPRHTGHGNRAGARRHAALNPAIDAPPAAIALAERERAAIELRKADCTYQQIAEELGYQSRSAARSAVLRGLGRWMREADEDLRQLELLRLEEIGRRLWPMMNATDPKLALSAINSYLRLMDYRAKITGLYNTKPSREVVVPFDPRPGQEMVENVHRFMVLTYQIREEDAPGMIDVEPVAPNNST